MTRFLKLTAAAVVAVSSLSATGCAGLGNRDERIARVQERSEERGDRHRNRVDPSWPERYNHVARLETLAPFQVQAQNGTYLDLTVWNYHFEAGTDKLTAAGVERLDYFVRKRGANEMTVFLQTSRDVGYDPNAPEKYPEERNKLDSKRLATVQKYLTTTGHGVNYDIQVHDPADPSIPARFAANAVTGLAGQFSSSISGQSGGGAAGGTGGGGGGQAGGGQAGGGAAGGQSGGNRGGGGSGGGGSR